MGSDSTTSQRQQGGGPVSPKKTKYFTTYYTCVFVSIVSRTQTGCYLFKGLWKGGTTKNLVARMHASYFYSLCYICFFFFSFSEYELFNSLVSRQTQIILFTLFGQGSLSHWSISSSKGCLNCLQANKRLFQLGRSNLSLWKAKTGKPHWGVFSNIIFHSSFRAIFKMLLLYWPLLNRLSAI